MKFSLQVRDFLKGLLMAIGTAIAVVLQNSISAEAWVFNWKAIGMAAVGAALTYLLKNYLTDENKVAKKVLTENAATPTDAAIVADIQTKK